MNRIFLHVDLDAFFASVEQLDNPDYRGKPVIVGGLPGERRSVVSTASYEARRFGVHSAMPMAEAVRLCPHGIFVHGRMQRYQELSSQIMDIFREYSPDVDQMSVDEAFIDLTGTEALFGPADETALELKKEVKDKTGLTVSVGLASSKYIAKIASGLSKPDGFCKVPPGKETEFMLSLPLNKMWGVGSKMLSRINGAGIFSTKDIYSKSESLLCLLFGNSTGLFLYNAVRGIDAGMFSKDPASHSISAETTFPYDITDIYTAETSIMELSHTVMFRLLKENSFSRTVMVKIRYDDFSTVSIRETSSSNISSIDDLYARACILFEKKYEAGRGIRLLGIGAENIADSSQPQQQELFDNGSEKKRAVEQAILKLERKHPEVRVHKARLLDQSKTKVVIAFLMLSLLCVRHPAFSSEMTTTDSSGAGSIVTDTASQTPSSIDLPQSLFNYTAGSNAVEFLAKGYWEAKLVQSSSASFGFGNPFALSVGVPVFKQNVDLSLLFMLNKTWFFQASFSDEFNKNTVAAGYHGTHDLKEVLIANRGIIFPQSYSVSLFNRGIGGGDNQAPGISAHMEDAADGKWKADAVIRYDMLKQYDATYYGKNSVSSVSVALSDWLTGQIFVLPSSDDVSAVEDVYVESSSGNYSINGRTYNKISSSKFLLLPTRSMVILSSDAGAVKKNNITPTVIFVFASGMTESHFDSELGTYTTGQDTFLGHIQTYFGSSLDEDSATRPDLANYAYSDSSTDGRYGLITSVGNLTALVVQSPAGFSPFACAYRYDCGITTATDAAVVSASTEKSSSEYSAVISDNDVSFVSSDFFSDKHTYTDICGSTDSSTASSALQPSVRYPLADKLPGCYLGYAESTDLKLLLRTYTPVSRYDIGTDAAAGSVSVYKNGILDQGATYDSGSGTVELSTSVSDTDKIYITWYKDSSSVNDGAAAAAAGFSYEFFPGLQSDVSIATRWALALSQKFADSSGSKPGFASLAAGLAYTGKGLSLTNASLASIETENVTGCYRIFGMDDETPQTYYLESSSGKTFPSGYSLTLNKRPSETSSSLPLSLDSSKNCTEGSISGATVSGITGYAVPLGCDFSSASDDSWAAAAITLNGGSLLASGTQFTIAVRTADTNVTGYDVYLQLGVYASSDLSAEVQNKIPTWKISDASASDVIAAFSPSTSGWQKITVSLTSYDRARFTKYHDARLIIVRSSSYASSDGTSPYLYAGPYETDVQSIFTSQNQLLSVTAKQQADSSVPAASKFNSSTNYSEIITWKNTASAAPSSDDDLFISAAKYFDETDIASYETVNICFSYYGETTLGSSVSTSNDSFTLIMDRGSDSIDDTGTTVIKAVISQSAFLGYINSSSRQYHTLSINLADKTVSVDDTRLSSNVCSVFVNTAVVPSRLKIVFDTACGNTVYKTGEFAVDELYCDGLSPHFLLSNTTKASYKKDGTILSAGAVPLIENVSLSSTATESATFGTKSSAQNSSLVTTSSSLSTTMATIAMAGDASLSSSESGGISNAGYSASTTRPVLGILSLSGAYRFDHSGSALDHSHSAAIDFSSMRLPLSLKAYTSASSSLWSLNQKSGADASLSASGSSWNTSLSVHAVLTQKILPSADGAPSADASSFMQGWKDSVFLAYSPGSNAASLRSNANTVKLNALFPFASFAPQFTFETGSKYTASSTILFSDTTSFTALFPFKIESESVSFEWTKKGGGSALCTAGGDYKSDYESLFSALEDRTWYFSAPPFYDLFSTDLSQAVLADTSMTTTSSDSLFYSTCYTTAWSRPLFNSPSDFFAPSSASIAIERDIRTAEKICDVYQIKSAVSATAFNVFGSESLLKTFSWYRQDEYTTSLTGAVKIPRDDASDITYQISAYTQENFYMRDADVLKTGFEIVIETDGDWSTEGTLVWKRDSSFSPLPDFVQIFWKSYKKEDAQLARSSGIDITFSRTDEVLKQVYILTNSLDAKLTKYFTATTGLTGTYTSTQDTSMLLSLALQIGGKLQF